MKHPTPQITCKPFLTRISSAVALVVTLVTPSLFAASGTWASAPVSGEWTNVLNWSGAVPGTINNTANNGVDTGSIATFTNPVTTYGGASSPVIPDDATIANGKARMMGRLNFVGANCGAYVFYSPSPYAAQTSTTPETGVLSLCDPSGAGNNGSYIDTAVTNPQVFLVPVQIRLPSSTTGTYGFTNNAANINATYYFSNLFLYPGATGRGVTFVFAGSNTGTNTVNLLSQSANQSGSPSGVRKEGTGRWILSGVNTFNSGSAMNINDGTLEIQNAGAFGSATAVTVNSNGVLQVDGVALTQIFNLNESGTVRMNGTGTFNGVTVSALVGATPTVATTGASDVLTLGNAANMVAGGSVGAVLHIAGPGTVFLSYANNYTGMWSIDSGTLQIASGVTGALGAGANLNVGAGAVFDLTQVTAGGGTYNPSVAGIGGSGTGTAIGSTAATIKADSSGIIDLATGSKTITLDYAPAAFTGDSTHPALFVSQGTLSLGNNAFTINNSTSTPLGVGTYQLIAQASGSITSAGGYSVTSVSGGGLAAGTVGTIVVNGGEVDLVVASYTSKSLVWKGGNPNNNWDINTTLNFLNGVTPSVFNNSDNVTFDSTGSANPSVNLAATVSPGSVTVDTTANNYTLTGSGQIGGGTTLTKVGTGTLLVQTVNSYGGNTTISNGVFQLGVNEAIPSGASAGSGDVLLQSPGTLDMNGFNNTINALIGGGTVDTVSGGTPLLTIGNNNDSGTFSGVIQNTAGTLALTKAGTGMETLTGTNTYAGGTTVSAGTLRIGNSQSLPAGGAVTVNGGTLDLGASAVVGTLVGTAPGVIANNSTTATNILVVTNTSTFGGLIADGSGGGGVRVLVSGGTLQLNTANTYSGGTILATGTTLGVGAGGSAGTGGILASNGAALASNAGGGTASYINNDVTTVSGATVNFYGAGAGGDSFGGLFIGDATATNVFNGQLTITGGSAGAPVFSNFLGVVKFLPNNSVGNRIYTSATTFVNGGDNTTFDFEGGYLFNRNPATFSLGAIIGGNSGGGISDPTTGPATYWIGAKGISTVFSGSISGDNNIVKVGTGKLTLNGGSFGVIGLDSNYNLVTNYVYTNLISYVGATTISNGVLAVAAPVSLTNSTVITLAASSAVLDASALGYIDSTGTNLVTNGVFEVYSGQTLAGLGTIRSSKVLLDAGSILNVGLPTGVLTATNNVELAGAVTINLSRTNTPNSGELAAQTFTIDGTATLVVTNAGPALVNGDKFTLFNKGVTFVNPILPATDPTGTTNYVWQNNLATDGTITLVSGGVSPINQNPPPILTSLSGNVLSLSWPTNSGWTLQMQTNNLGTGLGTNWVDLPGSTSITSTNITIDPTAPTVFFRLKL